MDDCILLFYHGTIALDRYIIIILLHNQANPLLSSISYPSQLGEQRRNYNLIGNFQIITC